MICARAGIAHATRIRVATSEVRLITAAKLVFDFAPDDRQSSGLEEILELGEELPRGLDHLIVWPLTRDRIEPLVGVRGSNVEEGERVDPIRDERLEAQRLVEVVILDYHPREEAPRQVEVRARPEDVA